MGEMMAGGDRNYHLPIFELLCELAQLITVRADVDAQDRDAALRARWVSGDGRQASAVGDYSDGAGGTSPCRVGRGGYSVASRDRANLFGPFLVGVFDDVARAQGSDPLLARGPAVARSLRPRLLSSRNGGRTARALVALAGRHRHGSAGLDRAKRGRS